MKVLWFANCPCGAEEKLGIRDFGGGWVKSLEDKLVENDEIELTVCFYWNIFLRSTIKVKFHY